MYQGTVARQVHHVFDGVNTENMSSKLKVSNLHQNESGKYRKRLMELVVKFALSDLKEAVTTTVLSSTRNLIVSKVKKF